MAIQRILSPWVIPVVAIAVVLGIFHRGESFGGAFDVTISVPTPFSSLDGSSQDSDGKADGTFSVAGSLTIGSGGSIFVKGRRGGSDITLNIGGDFLMSPSALITSGKVSGPEASGVSGDITILAAGDVTISAGAEIRADGGARAGQIEIRGRFIDVDGLVSTTATTPVGRGGPISIIASRDLTVLDLGVLRSESNRVHLEGCSVSVNGLVQSTGSGHSNLAGENLCNAPERPGHADNSTSCVEVWAALTITIDSTSAHNGEIDVDTAVSGLAQTPGWVELFSGSDIVILGDTSGTFAVHANQPNITDGSGGQILLQTSRSGDTLHHDVHMSGLALQADAIGAGGDGGHVIVNAAGIASLFDATLYARGDYDPSGGFGKGGMICTSGSLLYWSGIGDVRPTGTNVIPNAVTAEDPQRGVAMVFAFAEAGLSASFPRLGSPTTPVGSVPGSPCAGPLPAYVALPASICQGTPTPGPSVTNTPTATPNFRIIEPYRGKATPTPAPRRSIRT